jgi:hypothetical protein
MTRSTRFNREQQGTMARVERATDFVEDWMLQLVLFAAVVTAVALSLGSTSF